MEYHAVRVGTIKAEDVDLVRLPRSKSYLTLTGTAMSSFLGLAEQVLSATMNKDGSSGSDPSVGKTGGDEYNTPHHRQQPQGGFDMQQVLSHADADGDEESQGYISNAIRHVHDNTHQAQNQQVDESDLATYGPMIISALTAASSKSGMDVSTLISSAMGGGGGNQLMGLVMKEAGNFVGGGGQDKQSTMNGAAMTCAKLMMQGQLSSFIGGSNSGGLSMLGIGESLLKSRFG